MSAKTNEEYRSRNRELVFQAYQDKSKLTDLYYSNYGFLYSQAKKYAKTRWQLEDMLQLGYFALEKAVSSYVNADYEKYDFITFYRVWLRQYFYRFNCAMQYCVKIPEKEFMRVQNEIAFEEFQETLVEQKFLTSYGDETVGPILENNLHDILVTEMSKTLDEQNCYIIIEVYFKEKSMASVGRRLGITRDAVRKRVLKSLKLLKKNKNIQKLASEYLGVRS